MHNKYNHCVLWSGVARLAEKNPLPGVSAVGPSSARSLWMGGGDTGWFARCPLGWSRPGCLAIPGPAAAGGGALPELWRAGASHHCPGWEARRACRGGVSCPGRRGLGSLCGWAPSREGCRCRGPRDAPASREQHGTLGERVARRAAAGLAVVRAAAGSQLDGPASCDWCSHGWSSTSVHLGGASVHRRGRRRWGRGRIPPAPSTSFPGLSLSTPRQ